MNLKDRFIEFEQAFNKLNEVIEEAYLFGSHARDDYKEISDIDIAIKADWDISLKF